jgi:hypothetical protein
MIQIVPYVNGYFQIHCMNRSVTLFEDGIVASSESSQPYFKKEYESMLKYGWKLY